MLDPSYVLPTGKNAGKPVREVFALSVSVDTDACWHWVGKKFPNGYGAFIYRGRYLLAHRVAYLLHTGRNPEDSVVMHTCDNRSCVNPDHLRLGSDQENIRDMVSKGRDNPRRGLRHPRCKLSDEDVAEIKRLREAGELTTVLAAKFNVSAKTISVVSRGLQRKGVEVHMTPNEYITKALRTNNDMGHRDNLVHAAMLMCTESGEVMSEVKRYFAYGKELDRAHVVEELGDVMWGVALLCKELGITFEEIFDKNIKKLSKRYPELTFSAERATKRDLQAEMEAMRS